MTKLLSRKKVCERLGISPSTLDRWEEAKTFPTSIRGSLRGKKFWTEQSIIEWLNRQSTSDNIVPTPVSSPTQERRSYERRQKNAAERLNVHRSERDNALTKTQK